MFVINFIFLFLVDDKKKVFYYGYYLFIIDCWISRNRNINIYYVYFVLLVKLNEDMKDYYEFFEIKEMVN